MTDVKAGQAKIAARLSDIEERLLKLEVGQILLKKAIRTPDYDLAAFRAYLRH
jgi:hypothetical protein